MAYLADRTPSPPSRWAAYVSLLTMLTSPLSGSVPVREAAAQRQQRPDVEFEEEIEVRLVTLPVLARDRRGRPVTDLRPEELEVREGRGRRYPVAFLTPFFEPGPERRDLPEVRLITELPGGPQGVIKPSVREPRYLLILADLEHDPPIGKRATMEALVELVEHEVDPAFKVGLMSYDGELELRAPFTQERQTVIREVHRVYTELRPRPRITLELRMQQLLDSLEACEQPESSHFQPLASSSCLRATMLEYADQVRPQADGFQNALEGVIRYLSGLDGHKAVLALSGGIALEPAREVAEAMRALYGPIEEIAQLELSLATGEGVGSRRQKLLELAFRHNVSLSFVDRSYTPSDTSARRARPLQPGYRPLLIAHQEAQQELRQIAGATGGVFVHSTQVDEGLRRALGLIDGGYYVQFYLDDDEPVTPERLARMNVRSARRGVTLQHRRAYAGGRRSQQPSAGVVRGRLEVGRPVRRAAEGVLGDFIPLRIALDPQDLGYEEASESMAATFTVHLILSTAEGVEIVDAYHFLTHTYPLDLWRSGEIEPPTFTAWAEFPEGDYSVEAIVTVPQLGRRGHLQRDVKVRGSRDEDATETESPSETESESREPAGSVADREEATPPP